LTLDTATRVEVSFRQFERKIRLVQGQAMFQVAKDPSRPFSVVAGSVDVKALGTQFDVRFEQGQANVVLLEGRVLVEPLSRHGLARLMPALAQHRLKEGEQLTADATGAMTVATADVERTRSWQSGRLVFREEPLSEAVAELNRYNQRQLLIDDPALERLPVSGVFSTSHPENFLAAVAAFYPVRIEEREPNIVALRMRVDDEK